MSNQFILPHRVTNLDLTTKNTLAPIVRKASIHTELQKNPQSQVQQKQNIRVKKDIIIKGTSGKNKVISMRF
mgnify:CR=1 FL=1